MTWNIQGLKYKLSNAWFKTFCEQSKIFAFSEVWSCKKTDIETAFPDFEVFYSARTQMQKGGVAVCVHKSFVCHVKHLFKTLEDCIFLKIGKCVFDLPFDVLAAFVYIAPERSVVYGDNIECGIDILENNMTEVSSQYPGLPWILCGDFNARTAGLSDVDASDENRHAQPLHDLDELSDATPLPTRKSKDTTTNSYGPKLVDFCKENDLFIVNGRTVSDSEGEITCIANRGKSIVDYFICSRLLFDYVVDMHVADRCESDHFPLIMSFGSQLSMNVDESCDDMDLEEGMKFVWKEECAESFHNYICENKDDAFHGFMSALDVNTDTGSSSLVTFLQNAAQKMRSNVKQKKSRAQPPWWDAECEHAKQEKYMQLKRFRQLNSHEELIKYLDLKKHFKELCKTKHAQENDRVLHELNAACSDPNARTFWQKIKSLTSNRLSCLSSVSPRAWYDHFRTLLNNDQSVEDSDFSQEVDDVLKKHSVESCTDCLHAQLDDQISEDEIRHAINGLKKGKAAGPDGLSSDIFIHAQDVLVRFLCPLFNRVFESGVYPESWTKAVIFPLHKKGNIRNTDNYRGISLLNIISKLYSVVINNRLSAFCETNDSIPEAQAGFRKGYSTIDNIFSLQSIVQKYLTKKGGRFYSLFVDFSKAFDSVHRQKLLYLIMHKTGIHGNMFKTLEAMYKSVKTAVRIGSKITDYFDCISGVRQGCVLSPLLFSIFLSELQVELMNCGSKGIDIFADDLGVFLLMYADDIVLLSDSVVDLQKKILCLENYCKKWGLTVNMDKTKVVVFKNGGFVKSTEKWYYGNTKISVESCYTYLGVIFSTTLNWAKCVENLSGKALRAMAAIRKLYFRLQGIPTATLFRIFDSKVKPILLYGSEIWGLQRYDAIEQVHIKVCKLVLGVGRDVKNNVALGECGRFPIYIDCYVRVIKFWLRLLSMPDNRYPKQCYNMLKMHDQSGRHNWVTRVKTLLCSHGFGCVWEMQNVGNVACFLSMFKQRLADSFHQEWHDSLSTNPDYCTYHPQIVRASYIDHLSAREYRRALCLLRCNRLPLNAVTYRTQPIRDPFCKQCDSQCIEDLCHFMLICPKYASLRKKYLPLYYYRFPSQFKILLLCSNLSERLSFRVAVYINACLKLRQ